MNPPPPPPPPPKKKKKKRKEKRKKKKEIINKWINETLKKINFESVLIKMLNILFRPQCFNHCSRTFYLKVTQYILLCCDWQGIRHTFNIAELYALGNPQASITSAEILQSSLASCKKIWEMGVKCSPDSKVHGANMGPIWGRQDLN